MRFACEFVRSIDGARRTLFAELTEIEIKSVRMVRPSTDRTEPAVLAEAYALMHMYRIAPDGFRHLRNGVKPAPKAVTELAR